MPLAVHVSSLSSARHFQRRRGPVWQPSEHSLLESMAAGEGKDACSGVPSSEVFPDLDIKHVDPTDSIPAVDGVGPGFYDWRVVFPFLDAVLSLRAELAEEAKSTPWWYDWPEQSLYSKEDGMDWKVSVCNPPLSAEAPLDAGGRRR